MRLRKRLPRLLRIDGATKQVRKAGDFCGDAGDPATIKEWRGLKLETLNVPSGAVSLARQLGTGRKITPVAAPDSN